MYGCTCIYMCVCVYVYKLVVDACHKVVSWSQYYDSCERGVFQCSCGNY